jgi:hypothetical protein
MAALSAILRSVESSGAPIRIGWWCPGCASLHDVAISRWNANPNAPTISGDIVNYIPNRVNVQRFCHCNVSGGQITFQPDTTHFLSGQTVPIPNWPFAAGVFPGV